MFNGLRPTHQKHTDLRPIVFSYDECVPTGLYDEEKVLGRALYSLYKMYGSVKSRLQACLGNVPQAYGYPKGPGLRAASALKVRRTFSAGHVWHHLKGASCSI